MLQKYFWDPFMGVELVLHVDDFLVLGEEQDLTSSNQKLKEVYELKRKSLEVTSRTKMREHLGNALFVEWSLEATKSMFRSCVQCTRTEPCKALSSPMTLEDCTDDDWLAVCISQGPPDLSAAACQLATKMQKPTEHDWERLHRVQVRERLLAVRCLLPSATRGEWEREAHHGR